MVEKAVVIFKSQVNIGQREIGVLWTVVLRRSFFYLFVGEKVLYEVYFFRALTLDPNESFSGHVQVRLQECEQNAELPYIALCGRLLHIV